MDKHVDQVVARAKQMDGGETNTGDDDEIWCRQAETYLELASSLNYNIDDDAEVNKLAGIVLKKVQESVEFSKKRNEYVDRIVARAKQKDGGKTTCNDQIWRSYVEFHIEAARPNSLINNTEVDRLAKIVLEAVQKLVKVSINQNVPAVCPISASAMENPSNLSKKRKYNQDILNVDDISYGAFVTVKSYVQFCREMTDKDEFDYTFKKETDDIIKQSINELFPGEETKDIGNPSEKPRRAQLVRLLQKELADLGAVCIHKCPIVPEGKDMEQVVDVGIIKDNAIAVCIEYKLASELHSFRTQTAVYGTDAMNVFNRPCIVVQIRGLSMDTLDVQAFGIVVNYNKNKGPSHALSPLLCGRNIPGLKMLISGLRSYLKEYPNEQPGQWHQQYLSNVVSLHHQEDIVYKAYDYRHRNVPLQDQRKPNIELVRKYIDSNAKINSLGDEFAIVATNFFKREDGKAWYGPTQPKNLAKIIGQLLDLHQQNFVHGDVRLRNMILHKGILTDYDFSRPVGSLYPSTLQIIVGDGIRHPDVQEAIKRQTFLDDECSGDEAKFQRTYTGDQGPRIEQLQMQFEHDIFAMKYVLQQFQPLDETTKPQEDWKRIVELEDLAKTIEALDTFPGEVAFTGEMDKDNGGDKPSCGTGSPPKKEGA